MGQAVSICMLTAGLARTHFLGFGFGRTSEGDPPPQYQLDDSYPGPPGSQRAHLLGLSTLRTQLVIRTQVPDFRSHPFLILSYALLVLVGGEDRGWGLWGSPSVY